MFCPEIHFQTLSFQIKSKTLTIQVSQHPNLCPCNLASPQPEAPSLSQCPAWCLLTQGSIISLPLAEFTAPWHLPP